MQVVPLREVSSRGLRLLNVASSIGPDAGGISESVLQLSRALLDLGHEVETVSVDDPKSAWASSLPVPVHLKGPPHGRLAYSWEFHRWLLDNAGRFDAILSHGLWRYSSRASRRASRTAHRPYFVFPHAMLDPWSRRGYWTKQLRKFTTWWLAEEPVLRDAAAVFFATGEEMELARRTFRSYRCTERVMAIGAVLPPPQEENQCRVFAAQFPELSGKRVLLFLGRLPTNEGWELLLRAFLVVLQAQPKESRYDTHLMLAGPAELPVRAPALQKLAKACDEVSPGCLSFPGDLTGDLKWGALRTAEVFVLPAQQDDFSVAVAEALACGTPVLLPRTMNNWHEVESSNAGLADDATLAGYARLLGRWLNMSHLERSAMAKQAASCYREKFEIAKTARRLAESIRELLPASK